MLLYEFEGKQLFKNCGINIPASQLIDSTDQEVTIKTPVVLKAQVLSGKRAEGGGIIKVDRQQAVGNSIKELFGKEINGEKVKRVLVEEMIEHEGSEYYISVSYDTASRGPVLSVSSGGGTGVEIRKVETYPVNPITQSCTAVFHGVIKEVVEKLIKCFFQYDCELAEINPLVIVKGNPSTRSALSGQNHLVALDAKVILDDDADFRREIKFPGRNLFGRAPTNSEIEARKIDEGDHRGTAGSVYWDLDGDIAVLAAGGGGSVVNMDALIACGGRPADYTEHSGNPPREKLKKLTKIILAKPGLKGLWIVGGTANFTDIYETLLGFVEGLREIKPKPTYPIVIRRGGPRDQEAFAMLKEVAEKEGYDFHIYGRETPMTSTAKIMVDLAYGS